MKYMQDDAGGAAAGLQRKSSSVSAHSQTLRRHGSTTTTKGALSRNSMLQQLGTLLGVQRSSTASTSTADNMVKGSPSGSSTQLLLAPGAGSRTLRASSTQRAVVALQGAGDARAAALQALAGEAALLAAAQGQGASARKGDDDEADVMVGSKKEKIAMTRDKMRSAMKRLRMVLRFR